MAVILKIMKVVTPYFSLALVANLIDLHRSVTHDVSDSTHSPSGI